LTPAILGFKLFPNAARLPDPAPVLPDPCHHHHEFALTDLHFKIAREDFVRRVFRMLVGVAAVLFLLDAIVNHGRLTNIGSIRRLFNMAKENALAAWFASAQTLLTGLVLWLVTAAARQAGFGKWRRRGWALLAGFFTYIAIDDAAGIHERVGTALAKIAERAADAGQDSLTGRLLALTPSYEWHLIFGPVFGAMGVFILLFLWRELATRPQRLRLIAALGCYALAVGLDFVEGSEDVYERLAASWPFQADTLSHFGRTIEEFLELLGTAFFLRAFLTYFLQGTRRVEVKIGE
jgi:hypothetical protein